MKTLIVKTQNTNNQYCENNVSVFSMETVFPFPKYGNNVLSWILCKHLMSVFFVVAFGNNVFHLTNNILHMCHLVFDSTFISLFCALCHLFKFLFFDASWFVLHQC